AVGVLGAGITLLAARAADDSAVALYRADALVDAAATCGLAIGLLRAALAGEAARTRHRQALGVGLALGQIAAAAACFRDAAGSRRAVATGAGAGSDDEPVARGGCGVTAAVPRVLVAGLLLAAAGLIQQAAAELRLRRTGLRPRRARRVAPDDVLVLVEVFRI